MKERYLLVKNGCPHCREFRKAIRLINLFLPIDAKIQEIECSSWENYGIMINPIMSKFEKHGFNGYPYCIIDGIVVEPSSPEIIKAHIKSLVSEDLS